MPPTTWPKGALSFAAFFFAYYGYIGVFMPYASLYFAHQGMSAAQIGVLMSIVQVMRIFGPNLWGWVADHTSHRVRVLRITAWGGMIVFSGLLMGQSFAWFFGVMVLMNLFNSAQAPMSEALLLSELRGDLTFYGRLRLWGSVGFIVLVTVAGQLLDWYGITITPWLALAALALVGVASMRIVETPHPVTHHENPSVLALLRQPAVQAFFVQAFLMQAAHAAIYVFYSLYLEELGYSKTVIGMMWSLGVLAEIVFFFYQAPIFRRFSVRALLVGSLLLAFVRFLMIGFGAGSLLVLLAAQLLHAATFGAHNSASVAAMQRWFAGPLQARGQALFVSIGYGLGGTAGGLLMSLAWGDFGARGVFVCAALFGLAGALAAWLSFRWQAARPS